MKQFYRYGSRIHGIVFYCHCISPSCPFCLDEKRNHGKSELFCNESLYGIITFSQIYNLFLLLLVLPVCFSLSLCLKLCELSTVTFCCQGSRIKQKLHGMPK